jgi:hypothetical protein
MRPTSYNFPNNNAAFESVRDAMRCKVHRNMESEELQNHLVKKSREDPVRLRVVLVFSVNNLAG